MIAVDTNILVYAHRTDSLFHNTAWRALEGLMAGAESWAVPWPCVHEFLSIVTNRRLYKAPTPINTAIDTIDSWLESPTFVLLAESHDHWSVLRALVQDGRVSGGRVHDARIAALCLEHGVRELWSADRDFTRFPDLVTVNPLVARG